MEPLHKELSQLIIGCFYNVYNTLGRGFSEKVYENALCIELRKNGLQGIKQQEIKVFYEEGIVGDFKADIIVNDLIILELKAVLQIVDDHEAQLLNYLRATNIEVGYVLNFGSKAEFKRKVYNNDRKYQVKSIE